MHRPGRLETLNLSRAISVVFVILLGMLLLTIGVHVASVSYFYRVNVFRRVVKPMLKSVQQLARRVKGAHAKLKGLIYSTSVSKLRIDYILC